MSNYQFSNNAITTLGSSLSSTALTATVASGTGNSFPTPAGSEFFTATLFAAGNTTGTPNEIVKVTARSGDTMTIVRAQEGTSAQNWNVGDTFANFATASFWNGTSTEADVQKQPGNYAVDSGTANAGVITLSLAPANLAALVGVPLRITKTSSSNTGAYTLAVNGLPATSVQSINGTDLPSGALPSSSYFEVAYNGSFFVLTSTSTAFPGGFSTQLGTGASGTGDYTVNSITNNTTNFLVPASSLLTMENANGNAGQFCYSGSTSIDSAVSIRLQSTAPSLIVLFYQSSAVGGITTNGSTITIVGTSDVRAKDVEGEYDPGDLFDNIVIHNYTWKTGEKAKGIGPLAQELYEVAPHLVRKGDEDNAELDSDGYHPWTTSVDEVSAMIIAEIKSLRKRVKTGEDALKALQKPFSSDTK